MSKYNEQFKLKAVRAYLKGKLGFKSIAQNLGIGHSQLGRWVRAYQTHGIQGLRKKCSQYSASFKLQVLQYMWDNELSCNQTAAHFDIRHTGAISRWERSYREGGLPLLAPRPRGRPKMTTKKQVSKAENDEDKSRDELIAELNQLRMELAYRKKLQALVQANQKAAPEKKRKPSSN
jgi:transposase